MDVIDWAAGIMLRVAVAAAVLELIDALQWHP
jgi:hypothetical protein